MLVVSVFENALAYYENLKVSQETNWYYNTLAYLLNLRKENHDFDKKLYSYLQVKML